MRATYVSVVSFAAAVSAIGNSIVINNSLDKLYLWSTGDSISPMVTVAPGTSWSEQLHRGQNVAGSAIKITKVENGLFSAAPTQILGYTLDANRVWFSLDAVFGEPFAGQKLTVSSHGGTGNIEWPTGNDVGDLVRDSDPNSDVVLTIDPQAGSAPAPAPAPAAAPAAAPAPATPAPVADAPAPAPAAPAPAPADAAPSTPQPSNDGADDAEDDEDDADEEEADEE